jgi:hypothetical protein
MKVLLALFVVVSLARPAGKAFLCKKFEERLSVNLGFIFYPIFVE